MAFNSSTFLSDIVKFIRNDLGTNRTDAISAKRNTREEFVVTSYPSRDVQYPIITVKNIGMNTVNRLGMQSEGVWQSVVIEVRVWATNEKQRDELTQQVFTQFRVNQFGTGSSTDFELHDFSLLSAVPIDEDGAKGIKSRVMEYEYKIVIDS
jgi:hypothetical protein